MQAGGAANGSQDQLLGSLSAQSSSSASAVLLKAADSTGTVTGGKDPVLDNTHVLHSWAG